MVIAFHFVSIFRTAEDFEDHSYKNEFFVCGQSSVQSGRNLGNYLSNSGCSRSRDEVMNFFASGDDHRDLTKLYYVTCATEMDGPDGETADVKYSRVSLRAVGCFSRDHREVVTGNFFAIKPGRKAEVYVHYDNPFDEKFFGMKANHKAQS